jgi:hypothetical protein
MYWSLPLGVYNGGLWGAVHWHQGDPRRSKLALLRELKSWGKRIRDNSVIIGEVSRAAGLGKGLNIFFYLYVYTHHFAGVWMEKSPSLSTELSMEL